MSLPVPAVNEHSTFFDPCEHERPVLAWGASSGHTRQRTRARPSSCPRVGANPPTRRLPQRGRATRRSHQRQIGGVDFTVLVLGEPRTSRAPTPSKGRCGAARAGRPGTRGSSATMVPRDPAETSSLRQRCGRRPGSHLGEARPETIGGLDLSTSPARSHRRGTLLFRRDTTRGRGSAPLQSTGWAA